MIKKLELILSDNVIIKDIKKNINIKSDKIIYFKSDEKLITNQYTQISINNEYLIESNDITFDRTKEILGSNKNTTIKDSYNNELNSSEFKFFIEEQLVKAKNVSIKDNQGNITSLENFIGNLKTNQFFGKDVKINFNKKSFGNEDNDPRLYGNSISSTNSTSKISKGVFTTCKKNENCPPWELIVRKK